MFKCAGVGDVVYVQVFGKPIVILGTVEAVNKLLEKQGANYSD